MNENWKESINKCINIFGIKMTSAIIYAAQNKTNLDSNLDIELNVDNGVIKSNGFTISMDKNIPNDFYLVLKNINTPSDTCLDFDFVYKQNIRVEADDGFYAEAKVHSEHFVFCFKIQKDNKTAILFGNILPISYYSSNKKKTEVARLNVKLEVFDCINHLLNHNQHNKSLILELIEKQNLNDFLINTSTKYEDNSFIKYNLNMTTLDLSIITNNSSKVKKKI